VLVDQLTLLTATAARYQLRAAGQQCCLVGGAHRYQFRVAAAWPIVVWFFCTHYGTSTSYVLLRLGQSLLPLHC
jgi:hypothetical protein